MAWHTGIQKRKPRWSSKSVNQKLKKLHGFLEEDEAKITLAEFLKANVAFSSHLLLGIELFPYQALMIKSMIVSDYTMCVLARGSGKTFCCAIYLMLEMLLFPGCHIGVISASFRQAKMIMLKVEEILNNGKCPLVNKEFSLQKGTDQWTLTVGNSRATALPLAGGNRLRGFRFTRIIIDEFLLMPEKVFNEVILPFLGAIKDPVERKKITELENKLIAQGKMTEEDRYEFPNNKLILLSSPSFTFEYMYKLYKTYEALIFGEDISQKVEGADNLNSGNRAIIQLSYDVVPEHQYDQNMINQAKASMSEVQFRREFGAQFIDESDGYFKISKMEACTSLVGCPPGVEIYGDKTAEYVLSFDPSWSEEESSDNFAMHILRLDRPGGKLQLVHSYALAGTELKQHIFYFYYLLTNFNIVGVVGDYNGGVQFINSCNESKLFQDNGINLKIIDVDFDDPQEYQNDLIKFKNQYNKTDYKFVYLRRPINAWIRQANEILQASIDHQRIIFASYPDENVFQEQTKAQIPINELKWTKKMTAFSGQSEKSKLVEFIDWQKVMIEQTKTECANIEVNSTAQGSQTFDLPQTLKRQGGPDRPRKDSYSALVLGNWFGKIILEFESAKKSQATTFTPYLI